jgi:diguanylate cyclase (GGDEF)-like protein
VTAEQDAAGVDSTQRLRYKAHLAEDLWLRLLHVKWSDEGFDLLRRMATDVAQEAERGPGGRLQDVAEHASRFIAECDLTRRHLTGAEKVRISALVDGLIQALPAEAAADSATVKAFAGPARMVSLVTLDRELSRHLGSELRDAGFDVEFYESIESAVLKLEDNPPAAVVVDLPEYDGFTTRLKAVAAMHFRLQPSVLLLICGRGDLSARLAAIKAGAKGFFCRPVEADQFLERLRATLGSGERPQGRLLFLTGNEKRAERIREVMRAGGIRCEVLDKPVQLLQAMYRFEPNLVMVDGALEGVSGNHLVQLLRQHEVYCELPLLYLTTGAGEEQLDLLSAGVDDVLPTDASDELLVLAASNRLQRIRESLRRQRMMSGQDSVAHLANRRRFLADVEQILPSVGISISSMAVMLVSVDNFRILRERSGLSASDRLMVQAGRRLRRLLRPGHMLARYGDAGFAVMVLEEPEESVRTLGEQLCGALQEQDVEVAGRSLMLTASVGAALTDEAEDSAVSMVEQAELALVLAREQDPRVHVHNPRRDQEARRQRDEALGDDIRESLQQGRATLLYQPIAGLQESSEPRYEVLLRLRDHTGAELLPETVLGVAARRGFTDAVDRWVIAHTMDLLSAQLAQGRSPEMFVNVCADSVRDANFVRWLSQQLRTHPQEATRLVFEISEEQALVGLRDVGRFFNSVRELGSGTSLDHFGRSQDSVAMVRRMPVNYVKLDGRILGGLVRDSEQRDRVRTLSSKLRELGISVVASEVEDPGTLAVLWRLDVELAQGLFLQEPYGELAYDFSGSSL